jgi:RNA ligase
VPRLHDLFDILDFHAALDAGYIDVKKHPTEMLWIANYTDKAQFERVWTPVTKQCRGLIFDFYNEIVARPFPKFFNLGEVERDMLPGGTIRVMEKMDGSLGILYQERTTRHQPKYAIATRGSFDSDQARHATALLRQKYPWFEPTPGFTYLFEIIYPENRIVVDYAGEDNLYLLDIIDNETGRSALHYGPVRAAWTGPIAQTYEYRSITDVLAAEPKTNAEGFVVHFARDESRVKIKFDEYVRLHRLLTGVSTRVLWEYLAVDACKNLIEKPLHWGSYVGLDPDRAEQILAAGDNWQDTLLKNVPDEFFGWVRSTINQIVESAHEMYVEARKTARLAEAYVSDRRSMFEYVKGHTLQKEILRLITQGSDRDLVLRVWREVQPAYAKPFWNVDEATA